MKVLWLCNIMLPMIAKQLNMEASNKEGWLSGLADVLLKKRQENGIELSVAFPAPGQLLASGEDIFSQNLEQYGSKMTCYGFREDVNRPEIYEAALEERLRKIVDVVQPDIIHCFGTEYPHTLAMCRVAPRKSRLLISVQGLCTECAHAYFANLPDKVIRSVTLRDLLKRDSLLQQQKKFVLRGENEIAAVKLAGNVAGRTEWDRYYTGQWNPKAAYFHMNETLRPDFYTGRWRKEDCIPHSVFLSQGDYPLKGLHYMLNALPLILEKYPDTKVYVAGNSLVSYRTLKEKLKISAYGKYLRQLLRQNHLEDKVFFLGRLDSGQMKEQYLKSHIFVCCSSVENSPNSLGEAMLLGMPCVSANVGGVPSIFTHGEDGILYEGFQKNKSKNDNTCDFKLISKSLADAVMEMWEDENKMEQYCENARKHAEKNHDREQNYKKMTEIYTEITAV